MANYLREIPKQLAARRKAFAAAQNNPALLPSCWAIVRSIANNMYEYMRNSVIGGCTFPDRPVYLSQEDAAFLNFGSTPNLLRQEHAWLANAKAGLPPPAEENPPLPEDIEATRRGQLLGFVAAYGLDHHASRVYNLEPWLQDMYRDKLDVDFAEELQRQIDSLNAYMDSVPKSLQATGLTGKLAKGVMDAFTLFRTITGSSHQLERDKMSFVDRRSFVNTVQKIELIMTKADESLGAASAGKSVVRELFNVWKDANYELMALTRQLRALWAGTSLDDRIAELASMLAAVQKTLNRCTEDSREPAPQLPVFMADDKPVTLTREAVTDAFHAVIRHDPITGANTLLRSRDTRKYGPLSVVIAPGNGQPRYCSEMRKLQADDEEKPKTATQTVERETDVDRRVRYPMNCLVVPVKSDPAMLFEDTAEAWLEYNSVAFPVPYKEFFEAAKAAAPAVFAPPPDKEARDIPANYARRALARLVAAFVRWSRDGALPEAEALPGFEAFRDFVLSRLGGADFLVPVRYRPLIDLFAEAGPKRRMEIWKRSLGPRFNLDRQLVAANVMQKDWQAVRESLKYLPLALTQGNSNLENGFNKLKDTGDPFAENKALAFFQRFLTDQPDLKTAMVAIESQVAIEVETLRTQSESLGRVFQYDQASKAMMRRQASQLREKRIAANAHIDQYLTGMMYAVEGNHEAAIMALSMCLTPLKNRAAEAEPRPPAPAPDVVDAWFDEVLKPKDGKFGKKVYAGEDAPGTMCYDYVYYNLGIVYTRLGRHEEARMCFKGVQEVSPPETSYLYRSWATTLSEVAAAKLAGPVEVKK